MPTGVEPHAQQSVPTCVWCRGRKIAELPCVKTCEAGSEFQFGTYSVMAACHAMPSDPESLVEF